MWPGLCPRRFRLRGVGGRFSSHQRAAADVASGLVTGARLCRPRRAIYPCRPSTALLLAILLANPVAPCFAEVLDAQQSAEQTAGIGRVVATITTLEGTVQMPGVVVELRQADEDAVIAQTVTDGAGQVSFPDVPPGRYMVRATRPGFLSKDSPSFVVRPSESAQVLLDIELTFAMPQVEVQAVTPSPTNSVRPVSMSDMLAGTVMEVAPIQGDDFQSLLPLLPGVVRGPDGRLRIRGGQPTQGALQVSSASLIDPSSGDFHLDLPGQSIESVEVLANPFAAEYGRFSTSITQIRTRRGTNEWEFSPGNLMPRFRKWLSGVRGFEPRFSVRGPIKRDRIFLSQDFQFRYVATPVKSLPEEPEVELTSFDSFTRFDTVISSRHTLGGGVILFPREVQNVTLDTFRPVATTPNFSQSGASAGVVDRFAIAPNVILETTVAGRWFEIEANTGDKGTAPMVYAPESQRGNFFNDQAREVGSFQWVEALSVSRDNLAGQHVFKVGVDLQRSAFDGFSESRPIEIRRLDESMAEHTVFSERSEQQVSGLEFATFAQDRWRVGSRVTLEVGFRFDKDQIVDRVNFSPRGGVSIGLLPEGRGILRGGVGKFVQRTPLTVGAFPSYESRTVTRFAADGSPLGPAVTFVNVLDADLRAPEATVGNVEWSQRFGRRLLFKINYLQRRGSHEFILEPDETNGELRFSTTGSSRYKELESTVRYLGGERRDVTVSYVWSRGTADLNNFDQFYGNLRNPIVRANEHSQVQTDVPQRLLIRGNLGMPGQWDFAPVLELRSGFPFSAVDEFQDFVGPRNRSGRLPTVTTLDFALTRPWRFRKYRFRAGIRLFNVFGASADRDVQNNIASPNYGTFYNPIERSIGFTFGAVR